VAASTSAEHAGDDLDDRATPLSGTQLSQFAPWIRHVFLVTDQQRPGWLNEDCPRISVVDHRDLFGGRGRLPTYNSHALSARLHHIPGLAEHFLYLNDDVFFGRRTGAELWFDGNGQTRFHSTRTTTNPTDLRDDSPLAGARNHTFALVKQLTGRVRRRNLMHGPHAFSRQLLLDLEATIPEEFERTWGHQVRSGTDLVIERLASQVGHSWGRAIDTGRLVIYEYFNTGLSESQDRLRAALEARRADTLCINDGEGPVPVSERTRIMQGFLEAYFPVPSEFER
jgi:hypothetical protein